MAVAAGLIVALAGCQSAPPLSSNFARAPSELTSWNLDGRLGYRANDDGGSASVSWQQRVERGEMALSGPLGMGSARIRWSPGHAELETGKETVKATNAQELAWRLTGLELPVEALQYWVRGLPSPHIKASPTFGEFGELTALDQAGWQLMFDRYTAIDGLRLPLRIRAHHADQRFTLIIKEWEPLP